MCVPGPGRYFDDGPRSWPGRAIDGSDIVLRWYGWAFMVALSFLEMLG